MPNIIKSWKDFASVEDWIANTQAANSSVADIFAPITGLKAANMGIIGKGENSYPYEKSDPPLSAKLLVYDKPCYETFDITDVSQVRSLFLEAILESYATDSGVFGYLAQKMKARTDILKQIESLNWASNTQKPALTNLMTRWESTLSMLKIARPHPTTVTLPMNFESYQQLKAAENNDLSRFTGKRYETMKKVIVEFYDAYEKLFEFTRKYEEEMEEIKRFDHIYNGSELRDLLNKIPYLFFTPAEIKSLNMQETGDFTNITVAGLEGKTLGFVKDKPVNTKYVGLGQHNEASKKYAIEWASTKKVQIATNVDPRTVPLTSVLLTAAYFGWYVENKVCKELSSIPIDCLELKKMLFAAYNAGVEHIISAIKSLYNNNDRNITWLKVAAVIASSGRVSSDKMIEMKTYAENIPKRLTKL